MASYLKEFLVSDKSMIVVQDRIFPREILKRMKIFNPLGLLITSAVVGIDHHIKTDDTSNELLCLRYGSLGNYMYYAPLPHKQIRELVYPFLVSKSCDDVCELIFEFLGLESNRATFMFEKIGVEYEIYFIISNSYSSETRPQGNVFKSILPTAIGR